MIPRKKKVVEKMATLITAAFALVAALAWNEAIQQIFREFFGEFNTALPMVLYAITVTIIAILAGLWVGSLSGKIK